MRILDTKQLPTDTHTYKMGARGKRRAYLLFKREPNMFLAYVIGTTFKEACASYFAWTPFVKHYNRRRNTYRGHALYCPSSEAESNKMQ